MLTDTATWFITGASSGYGLAIARYASGQGYNVVAKARSVAKHAALTALAPDRVLAQKLDVTIPTDATKAVKAAIAQLGRIDVLTNNAGTASSARSRKRRQPTSARRWTPTSSAR
jgi:NADP-dependent 3-hydroxy acid dehydrogenase YdfG